MTVEPHAARHADRELDFRIVVMRARMAGEAVVPIAWVQRANGVTAGRWGDMDLHFIRIAPPRGPGGRDIHLRTRPMLGVNSAIHAFDRDRFSGIDFAGPMKRSSLRRVNGARGAKRNHGDKRK